MALRSIFATLGAAALCATAAGPARAATVLDFNADAPGVDPGNLAGKAIFTDEKNSVKAQSFYLETFTPGLGVDVFLGGGGFEGQGFVDWTLYAFDTNASPQGTAITSGTLSLGTQATNFAAWFDTGLTSASLGGVVGTQFLLALTKAYSSLDPTDPTSQPQIISGKIGWGLNSNPFVGLDLLEGDNPLATAGVDDRITAYFGSVDTAGVTTWTEGLHTASGATVGKDGRRIDFSYERKHFDFGLRVRADDGKTEVPEPGSLALAGLGLSAALTRLRRRRAR